MRCIDIFTFDLKYGLYDNSDKLKLFNDEIDKYLSNCDKDYVLDLLYYRALNIRDLNQPNSAMDSLEMVPSLYRKIVYPHNFIQFIIELHKDGIEIPANMLNWIKRKLVSKSMPVEHSEYLRAAYRKFFSPVSSLKMGRNIFNLIHSSELSEYSYIHPPIVLNFKDIEIFGDHNFSQKTPIAHIRGFNLLLLKNTKITGGSSIILLQKKRFYCEHFETSMSNKVKFNHDPILLNFTNPLAVVRKIKTNLSLELAINLVGMAHSHFAHFFFNAIPKLFAANHQKIDKSTPVLIDFDLSENLIDMIRCLGYNNLIKIGLGESVSVKKLFQGVNFTILPDLKAAMVVENITNSLDPRLFKNYSAAFLKVELSTKDKLYIPRMNSIWGKVSQEHKIIDKMKALGFRIVYPESLHPKLQAELFAGSNTIVTAPSSALANLVYSKPGTKVHIIADSQLFQYSGWLGPFESLGIRFYWHNILKPTNNSRHPNFMFSDEDLDNFIKDIND